MNLNLAPLEKSVEPVWKTVKALFAEHNFLTILCAFFAVMMVISCYRLLKSISPALVLLICGLILFILLMHWVATRTEPKFLSPFVDWLAQYAPVSNYSVPPPKK